MSENNFDNERLDTARSNQPLIGIDEGHSEEILQFEDNYKYQSTMMA